MKKFVLTDGYVSMDTKQLHVELNTTKKDIKNRGGWLGILLSFLTLKLFLDFSEEEVFDKVSDYFSIGFQFLGVVTIILIFMYLLFLRKSKNNLMINDIIKIELDKQEFETNVSLVFSSKREFDLSFRNLENQIAPFLEELKKRNTRLKIESI